MTFDRPLTIRERAEALNWSRTGVYEALARGEMVAVKLHGKTLVRSSEVERFFVDASPGALPAGAGGCGMTAGTTRPGSSKPGRP